MRCQNIINGKRCNNKTAKDPAIINNKYVCQKCFDKISRPRCKMPVSKMYDDWINQRQFEMKFKGDQKQFTGLHGDIAELDYKKKQLKDLKNLN